jgi:hypothetical protein
MGNNAAFIQKALAEDVERFDRMGEFNDSRNRVNISRISRSQCRRH